VTVDIRLREVTDADLPVFFAQQLDPVANQMVAFTGEDPTDRDTFEAHWARIRADESVSIRTIVCDGGVAGHVVSFERDGQPEVSYWIGKEHWGKGIATRALAAFLREQPRRPLQARVAKDNAASIRVLEKCGFTVIGEDRSFANARGEEIDELILELRA
jgi:RimJ/RimL family protein N-acetyltransferase